MDIDGGSFFNMYYPDMSVSFSSHKDEVIEFKSNMYRYDQKERCDWAIIQNCSVNIIYLLINNYLFGF